MRILDYTPLEITLIKKGKTRQDLKEDINISGATLAKIAKREFISLNTIHKMCEYLDVEIDGIVRFKKV